MEDYTTFGEWLVHYRESLHLQRSELAARIGCAVVTLRKIEADERRPSRQMAEQLAEQLAIPANLREVFIRVARGELGVNRLALPTPATDSPSNLPYPTTSFAGREREVREICNTLARPEVRLLTLTGAPGVGKTRLALEASSEMRSSFSDGVFLVALGPLRDARLVLVAISQALHVGTSGGQTLVERLSRYLRTRQVLLVLDNFEHVMAAAPQLSQLLHSAPRLKLLVTSRIALEISGEHRFTVLPLQVPPASANRRVPVTAAQEQERYPAVDLFIQRARAVKPDLALSDANVRTIGEICRRLDGLPLAIEFAAARSALFTPQELLVQLDDRFALTGKGSRDLPERHNTLWNAIDWSYSLLTPSDQQLFRRLSIFAGGSTLEAAREVCGGEGETGTNVIAGVTTLVDSSLLQRQEGYEGHSRYTMFETVRDYALKHLISSGEEGIIKERHAAFFLKLAQGAEQTWDMPEEWEWMRRLVLVRDDLRAALGWTLETRNVALALRFNAALFTFWTIFSVPSEARRWVEATLAFLQPGQATGLVADEAKVWNLAGYLCLTTSDYAQAYLNYNRGLSLYRSLEDIRGMAWSIRGIALLKVTEEEYSKAEQLLNESLELCKSNGEKWGLAWTLYAKAFLQFAQGHLELARPMLEETLGKLRQQNLPFGVFRTLLALGYTLYEQGEVAGAEAKFREALMLSRKTPLLTFITAALEGSGMVRASQGQPEKAAHLWGAAEALREITDERRWHAFQRGYDKAFSAVREQISQADWTQAWAEGRGLTVSQAVDEALGDTRAAEESGEVFLPYSTSLI